MRRCYLALLLIWQVRAFAVLERAFAVLENFNRLRLLFQLKMEMEIHRACMEAYSCGFSLVGASCRLAAALWAQPGGCCVPGSVLGLCTGGPEPPVLGCIIVVRLHSLQCSFQERRNQNPSLILRCVVPSVVFKSSLQRSLCGVWGMLYSSLFTVTCIP